MHTLRVSSGLAAMILAVLDLVACFAFHPFLRSPHQTSGRQLIRLGGQPGTAEYQSEDEIPALSGAPLRQLVLKFNCVEIDPDEVSELLFELGTLSVSVEVESERPDALNEEKRWNDITKTNSWALAVLRANFPASFDHDELTEILRMSYPSIQFDDSVISVTDVANIDWQRQVQQDWKPQVIGDLVVKFPWHEDEQQIPMFRADGLELPELVLDGGAAFGTGDHPTTRLCCRWLQRCLSPTIPPTTIITSSPTTATTTAETGVEAEVRIETEPAPIASQGAIAKPFRVPKDVSVLDYGCGSAILGLAALRAGAGHAVGVDIDRDSLISARSNCIRNDLQQMELYITSDVKDEAEEEGDEVIVSTGEVVSASGQSVGVKSELESTKGVEGKEQENALQSVSDLYRDCGIDEEQMWAERKSRAMNQLKGNNKNFVGYGSSSNFSGSKSLSLDSKSGGESDPQEQFPPSDEAIHGQTFDIVVANILAPILISLAPQMAAYTKSSAEGGRIALSGVISRQAGSVMKAYEPFFEHVQVEEEEEGWVLITAYNKK